jgi:putative zinc finger/helix-turn-helix YgiT family protein
MRCFVCGKGAIKRKRADVEATVRGERYLVKTPALVCNKCGHVALEGEDAPEYMRRGADAYRKAHGLLTGSEIQARRHVLKMNQRQFAAYLGVGEASVKRWELGQIQDAAMNELIVLKTDPAAAQRNLAEINSRLTAHSS